MSQLNDKQIIAWYQRRYTPEQIKKIQSYLNRQQIGKQLPTDGKVSIDFINSVKTFQSQHQDALQIDGLVGDRTLNALGININDPTIPGARKGVDQSRGARKVGYNSAGKRVSDIEAAVKYMNSKEMQDYLMGYAGQYFNWKRNGGHSDEFSDKEAAKYEGFLNRGLEFNLFNEDFASRLRYTLNMGDQFDEERALNHNQAKNREYGMHMLADAIAKGYVKTADDYDRWMKQYNLSKEEMQEVMSSPAVAQAQNRAGVQADIGRMQSDRVKAKEVTQSVTDAINEAGTKYALPLMSTLAFGPAALPSALGSLALGQGVDWTVQGISDNKYDTWGQMLSDKLNVENPYGQYALEMTNPGYWIMPAAELTMGTHIRPQWKNVKGKPAYYIAETGERVVNPNAGGTHTVKTGKTRTRRNPSTIMKNRKVNPAWKSARKNWENTDKISFDGNPGTALAPYTPTKQETGQLQLTLPEVDYSDYFAPHLGFNRNQFKTGGIIEYSKYL